MIDPALRAALQDLAAADPNPQAFERIARWRRSCGDGAAAARWHLWSLMPPAAAELRQALAELWVGVGELSQAEALLGAAAEQPSWSRLALLQRQAAWDQAEQLQNALLRDPPPLDQSQLLALAATWQQAQKPNQALALMEALLAHDQRRGLAIEPPLANAVAQLLEEQQRPEAAAVWWRHSLRREPQQVHPMMRLAREALRQGEAAVAVHYLRCVLDLNPQHPWAPGLLRQGLEGLGARGSLALLDGLPLPHPWRRRQQAWLRPLQPWLQPPMEPLLARGPARPLPSDQMAQASRLALWGDADGLVLAPLLLQATTPLEIWLLASVDPLLQQHNLERVQAACSHPHQLRSWPTWDPTLHGEITVLVDGRRGSRPWPPLVIDPVPVILRWQVRDKAWSSARIEPPMGSS
jgi:tetratricopeptide (TPR) repeat protein